MPSADLGPKSHSDEDGDLAEQPPGATSRAAWHPDDTGQPPVWPRDISFHQPGLPGHANHAPRPPEDATPDARHPDDLHHHPQTLGDLAQDSSSLCLWPYEPGTVDISKLLPGQHVHGALLKLQHLLAQADHYALDDPDLPGHDVRPPPLPGERFLLFLLECSRPQPETNKPTSPLVHGVAARWLCTEAAPPHTAVTASVCFLTFHWLRPQDPADVGIKIQSQNQFTFIDPYE